MRLTTALSQRLALEVPIFQAPMASVTTPALAAGVSNAGGLGALGCAYMQPDVMRRDVAALRALTRGPFQLNFFVAPQPDPVPAAAQREAIDALSRYYRELGLPPPDAAVAPYAPDLDGQLDAALELRPAVVTCHLNELPAPSIAALRAAGIVVGGSATCVAEAKRLQELGMDFVVAQGGEAGGHRGTWTRDPQTALTGTLALVRLLVQRVDVPVVAAGGIMDGAAIAAVLALGAQAAQLGTAFIPCPESAATEVYRAALLGAAEDDTSLTDKFSGKPARGLRNRYMRETAQGDFPRLPFPAQNQLTAKLRTASAQAGSPELMALWAGQAVAMSRRLPAGELVRELEREALETIDRLERLRVTSTSIPQRRHGT
ncbi:MAG TPA: nitronate monooxygenase family protein [Burkholderiales bacterium]|nr:nitronate monooxygenase family protein [Burkholderiales bacterium]